MPDGYISGHANQARITTFPLDDAENCRYSADVVSFAQSIGLYPKDSPAEDFSFSDIYDPVTFEGARFCEVFSRIMGEEWSNTSPLAAVIRVTEGRVSSVPLLLFCVVDEIRPDLVSCWSAVSCVSFSEDG